MMPVDEHDDPWPFGNGGDASPSLIPDDDDREDTDDDDLEDTDDDLDIA